MSATVSTRIDQKTKDQANLILDSLGLDMSTAINIYLKQIVIQNKIPFEITMRNQYRLSDEFIDINNKIKNIKNKKSPSINRMIA